ncbi:DUF1501 domain-containing protein [Novosphingobium sp.]|uniref:DUF1501 domain-containing protein n=1 Tax=Novosphingobium sp. TaxID=1874826 RepID=UPI0025D825BC|nr:DUF1501 domain-containing protein [Novosphingobium sp.]
MTEPLLLRRRSFLTSAVAGLAASAFAPRMAYAAAPTDQRFVFVIQRGAADGLHIVPPLGDPGFAGLRGALADSLAGAKRLDAMFGLHPALVRVGQLFDGKQALAVHAVASAYRDRSHFDGQNILETGGTAAYAEKVGWMNRLAGALPGQAGNALALAPEVPMALRGPVAVSSYAPSALPQPQGDLFNRVSALYAGDPQLAGLWQSALATRALAGQAGANAAGPNGGGGGGAQIGKLAASLLEPADGARLMMIETTGWDTHTAQPARLNGQLKNLDAMIGALADGLGPLWANTMVVVATEFGRTAAVNGTQGTDHGTGSAALVLGGGMRVGGPLSAGRVHADWPGLGAGALYENRDLKPTMAMEALIAGTLAQHYGQEPARLIRAVYPDQPGLKPVLI